MEMNLVERPHEKDRRRKVICLTDHSKSLKDDYDRISYYLEFKKYFASVGMHSNINTFYCLFTAFLISTRSIVGC